MPGERGPADPGPAERARLAAEALARAKEDARARGEAVPRRSYGGRPGSAGRGAGPAGREPGQPDSPAGGGSPAGESPADGAPPGSSAATGGTVPANRAVPTGRGASAGRPRRARRDDPELLRSAINNLLDDRGWRDDAAVGGVFGRWDQIVGAELAAHTRPDGFSGGELLVTADSTAWATQVRLLAGTLVARINAELGGTLVRRVKVRGPAPPPQAGPWRVRGGRGPRDDYG